MRDLLPDHVAVAVAGEEDWTGPLLPAETAGLTERVVPARRREFTAARVCARRAFAALGLPPTAVPVGADRAPIWPAGTVGSITHTREYCAVAVARSDEVRAVGIDAERVVVLEPAVLRSVCLPGELDGHGPGPWPIVVFSAKEAVYKLWSPYAGTWLDFHDVRVTLSPESGTFRAEVAPARLAEAARPMPAPLEGRFAVSSTLVRTAVLLPHA